MKWIIDIGVLKDKALQEGMGEIFPGLEVGIDFLNRTQTPFLTKSKTSCSSKDMLMRTAKTPTTDWEKKTQF